MKKRAEKKLANTAMEKLSKGVTPTYKEQTAYIHRFSKGIKHLNNKINMIFS